MLSQIIRDDLCSWAVTLLTHARPINDSKQHRNQNYIEHDFTTDT